MQAIVTKVLPATTTKPTRIKASCERGSIVVSYDHEGMQQAHVFAANELCRRFVKEDCEQRGHPMKGNPWARPFVSGQLPNGDWAHVETGERTKYAGLVECLKLTVSTLEKLNDETAHPMHAHVAHVILSAKDMLTAAIPLD